MAHIWKIGSDFEKWDTLEKIVYIWKNEAHFEKLFTSGKTGQK